MLILSCNVGSTSLKYRLFDLSHQERELANGHFAGIGRAAGRASQQAGGLNAEETVPRADYSSAISAMLAFLEKAGVLPQGRPDAVAFKVVAALNVTGVVALDEQVLSLMAAYNSLLPAHNPPYIAAIRQFMEVMPGVPLVGSFETGFFSDMEPQAYRYALPRSLVGEGVRKNGAHGASHEYVSQWLAKALGREDARLITCHLGGSSSVAAVKNGRGVDTTLGLSLQSGLPHNNRLGDADPYLSIYLEEGLGYTRDQVKTLFSQQGGLLGLSGFSGEMWQLVAAAREGDDRAGEAVACFCYALKKTIGAFAAALGGVDAISFTGGIGQNTPLVREKSLEGLDFMGIQVDKARNESAKAGDLISPENALCPVYVVATNEEIIIARKARAFLLAQS